MAKAIPASTEIFSDTKTTTVYPRSMRCPVPPRLALWLLLTLPASALAQQAQEEADPPQAGEASAGEAGEPEATPTVAQPVDAEAEQEPLERARRRFARGVELAQRGDYRAAAARFREALAMRDAPAVRFNLASALYEAGDHVESFNELVVVLEATDLAPEVRERAEVLVTALGEEVATLDVRVGGDTALRVLVDGQPLPPERFGTRFAVEPGTHHVEAWRGDTRVSRRELTVEPGTLALVDMSVVEGPAEEIPAVATTVASEPAARAPAERPERAPKRFGVRDWRLWAVVGGAVVAIAAAGVAVGLTRSEGASAIPGDFEPTVLSWK